MAGVLARGVVWLVVLGFSLALLGRGRRGRGVRLLFLGRVVGQLELVLLSLSVVVVLRLLVAAGRPSRCLRRAVAPAPAGGLVQLPLSISAYSAVNRRGNWARYDAAQFEAEMSIQSRWS